MASETPQEYTTRILSLQQGKDPGRILASTPGKIERLLRGRPRALLTRRPAPQRWSVAEILAHLADAELVIGYRIRTILGRPGTPIQAYDQDEWARVGHYDERDALASLKLFSALRTANLALWRSLQPSDWKAHGLHAERGKETIEQIWRHDAGHDLNHLRQIMAILEKAERQRAAKKKIAAR